MTVSEFERRKNPYKSPESALESTTQSKSALGTIIQLTVGLVCALLTALAPMAALPQFHQVFQSYGAQLPWLTNIALDYHLWLWILPIAVLAAFFFWPNARRRPLASCLIGIIGLVVFIPVMAIAMYMPIFQLGAVL